MKHKLVIMPGDGIGKEITAEALKVLDVLQRAHGLSVSIEQAHIGGAGYEAHGHPLPQET